MTPPTFSHALYDVAARCPDRCAFRLHRGRSLTFAGLNSLVEAAAAWLRNFGVRHGDVVFLMFPNTVEFVVLLMAVMRCRAVAAPIDPSCTVDNFKSCLQTYQPKLLFVGRDRHPTEEAAAAEHDVSHAVASVHYDPSDSVSTSASVLLTHEGKVFTLPVPATISCLVNEPEDQALVLPLVDPGPTVPVTQYEFVASTENSNLAQCRLLPLFQAHSLLRDFVSSLSITLRRRPVDAEDEYTFKLYALVLPTSMSALFFLIITMMNKKEFMQPHTWINTTLVLLFASFVLSLVGVVCHCTMGRSSMYVGKVALSAFVPGLAVLAKVVISELPEKHRVVATLIATVCVGLVTILVYIRDIAWLLHPRGRIREAAAEMAAATPASSTGAIAAAAVESPIQGAGAETVESLDPQLEQ